MAGCAAVGRRAEIGGGLMPKAQRVIEAADDVYRIDRRCNSSLPVIERTLLRSFMIARWRPKGDCYIFHGELQGRPGEDTSRRVEAFASCLVTGRPIDD